MTKSISITFKKSYETKLSIDEEGYLVLTQNDGAHDYGVYLSPSQCAYLVTLIAETAVTRNKRFNGQCLVIVDGKEV